MKYLTCCVDSTAELINALQESGREISYATARRLIGPEEMDRWAAEMLYDVGNQRGGLRLKDDWHVEYYRGVYDGTPCVYIVHSRIEYIFTPEACMA